MMIMVMGDDDDGSGGGSKFNTLLKIKLSLRRAETSTPL
jgi:hypothetical protein